MIQQGKNLGKISMGRLLNSEVTGTQEMPIADREGE